MAVKQTAGRDTLNDFAPEFAHLNDDILFGIGIGRCHCRVGKELCQLISNNK